MAAFTFPKFHGVSPFAIEGHGLVDEPSCLNGSTNVEIAGTRRLSPPSVEVSSSLWHGTDHSSQPAPMTILNNTHKFIFVHVPKTAGTAVTQYFRWCGGEADVYVVEPEDVRLLTSRGHPVLQKHSTAVEVRRAIGRDIFESYFKFSITRNPFARAVSTFRFLKYKFRGWPKSDVMSEFNSLEEFVTSDFFRSAGPGGIFRPQIRWLANRKGKVIVDYMCRIETLDHDLANVTAKLGLPISGTSVGRINLSGGDTVAIASGLNSGTVVDAIRRRYVRDFDLLGYSTEPADAVLSSVERPPPAHLQGESRRQ